jgi:hypothetical protein
MSKDSRDFFPPSGSFQPVVPLSEIAGTPDELEITPHAPQAKLVAGGVQNGLDGTEEGGRPTPGDEDEETLVPARRRISTRPLAQRAGRRKSRLPSWRFIVPCLAAMLVGGVIADAFWRSVRSPARVEEAASVAEGAPAAADAETTDAEAPPATEEANAGQPQTAPQESAPETPAATEAGLARRAADDSKTLNAEITSATVVTPSARKRIAAEVPSAESRGRQPSSARDATDKSAAEARPVRREPAPRRRAPGTQSPVLTSTSRDQSLPVFSPPPSDKSGKKDVIQWP